MTLALAVNVGNFEDHEMWTTHEQGAALPASQLIVALLQSYSSSRSRAVAGPGRSSLMVIFKRLSPPLAMLGSFEECTAWRGKPRLYLYVSPRSSKRRRTKRGSWAKRTSPTALCVAIWMDLSRLEMRLQASTICTYYMYT